MDNPNPLPCISFRSGSILRRIGGVTTLGLDEHPSPPQRALTGDHLREHLMSSWYTTISQASSIFRQFQHQRGVATGHHIRQCRRPFPGQKSTSSLHLLVPNSGSSLPDLQKLHHHRMCAFCMHLPAFVVPQAASAVAIKPEYEAKHASTSRTQQHSACQLVPSFRSFASTLFRAVFATAYTLQRRHDF